jgi:hypothetical protein
MTDNQLIKYIRKCSQAGATLRWGVRIWPTDAEGKMRNWQDDNWFLPHFSLPSNRVKYQLEINYHGYPDRIPVDWATSNEALKTLTFMCEFQTL